jgi:hypothetical protein
MANEPHPAAAKTPLHERTRRQFFQDCGVGVGKIALASLLAGTPAWAAAPANPLAPRAPHFAGKAKRVIYLFMAGAPSQLDLFDNKPSLVKYDGQPIPAEIVKNQRYAFIQRDAALMASRFQFARHGQSGAELSEMLPHLASVVDDIALIKTVHTNQFNHAPAQIFMNTGSPLQGRPSMGAWVTYGLGVETSDLPGFVVLSSGDGAQGGAHNWGCGFMPTVYQGVPVPQPGRSPFCTCPTRKGVDAALAAGLDRSGKPDERTSPWDHRRPRDPHAHQRLRDGLPHAEQRAGTDRPCAGERSDARDVRRGRGQALVRAQLPARAPARGARHPLRRLLPRRLGSPQRRGGRRPRQVRRDRSGLRRTA